MCLGLASDTLIWRVCFVSSQVFAEVADASSFTVVKEVAAAVKKEVKPVQISACKITEIMLFCEVTLSFLSPLFWTEQPVQSEVIWQARCFLIQALSRLMSFIMDHSQMHFNPLEFVCEASIMNQGFKQEKLLESKAWVKAFPKHKEASWRVAAVIERAMPSFWGFQWPWQCKRAMTAFAASGQISRLSWWSARMRMDEHLPKLWVDRRMPASWGTPKSCGPIP